MSALCGAQVRFVLIGVAGANYYAQTSGLLFVTQDRDLFLPPEPDNELRAWLACRSLGLELSCGGEPLGEPVDQWLAEQVVARRALVRADAGDLHIDLSLVMAGYEFEGIWPERRVFRDEGVEVPVARLEHIVASKATAGRPKDRLFLATHEDALRQLGRRRLGRPPKRTS